MSRRAPSEAGEQLPRSEENVPRPVNGEAINGESKEAVALGVGNRACLVEQEPVLATRPRLRGLLPVPPEVEADITLQETEHPMTPEYRNTLRDWLTVQHYFSDVEIAFRRTPRGIEVLAAGFAEIAAFRRTSTRAERQGVVYGVG
jgi:hypothetical protein